MQCMTRTMLMVRRIHVGSTQLRSARIDSDTLRSALILLRLPWHSFL